MKNGFALTPVSSRIEEKVRSGVLPGREEPLRTQILRGGGLRGDGCDVPIVPNETEHAVEVANGRVLRFHVACDELWRTLRNAVAPKF